MLPEVPAGLSKSTVNNQWFLALLKQVQRNLEEYTSSKLPKDLTEVFKIVILCIRAGFEIDYICRVAVLRINIWGEIKN